MKLAELLENVVKFETPEAKDKRSKKEKQLKQLKSIDHEGNQKKLDVMSNRGKFQLVKK